MADVDGYKGEGNRKMTSYYDNTELWDSIGADYDLLACLEFNPQGSFTEYDIERVLAVSEGENDGPDWHWILLMKPNFRPPSGIVQGKGDEPMLGTGKSLNAPELGGNKRQRVYCYLVGGCDYTGWDCQSSAEHTFADSPESALELIDRDPDSWRYEQYKLAYDSIKTQLETSKNQTWRERMDKEFGLKD